jgi:hypothetical protein
MEREVKGGREGEREGEGKGAKLRGGRFCRHQNMKCNIPPPLPRFSKNGCSFDVIINV